MIVNAFTNGFHGWPSTQGHKTPRFVEWVYGQQDFDGMTIFEDGWMFQPETPQINSRVKVGWLCEPRALHPENYEHIGQVADRFQFILTYDAELLRADPDKFKLCPRLGVDVPREHWGLWTKTKDVAMIATQKNTTPGHKLRRAIAEQFKGCIDIFGIDAWADKAQVLKEYRYAVCIESERAKNFFTCHLLDAIALGCMPLYWGAFNIGEYLNASGIIPWNNLDVCFVEQLDYIRQYGEGVYRAAFPALQENLEMIGEYELPEDWIFQHYFSGLEHG